MKKLYYTFILSRINTLNYKLIMMWQLDEDVVVILLKKKLFLINQKIISIGYILIYYFMQIILYEILRPI